jgi:hypothetical protein
VHNTGMQVAVQGINQRVAPTPCAVLCSAPCCTVLRCAGINSDIECYLLVLQQDAKYIPVVVPVQQHLVTLLDTQHGSTAPHSRVHKRTINTSEAQHMLQAAGG